jgi:hypothetical protein
VVEIHKLYRCHDRLLVHKQAVFEHLTGRWRDLFNIPQDVPTNTPAAVLKMWVDFRRGSWTLHPKPFGLRRPPVPSDPQPHRRKRAGLRLGA